MDRIVTGLYNEALRAMRRAAQASHRFFGKQTMRKRARRETTIRADKPRTYSVFFRRERNGVYTAHIPALDVVTEGKTLDQAKKMATDAIAGWIEAARELGKRIPDDVPTAQVEVAV